jgi:hypothetical protein
MHFLVNLESNQRALYSNRFEDSIQPAVHHLMLNLGPVAPTNNQQVTAVTGETKIQLTIAHPEIILVENPMNIDSNAIILSVSI